ncbi:cytosine deaminase-like metal-dependent hydrolase [Halogeometricum borinquense DSM 11551]|uniref:Cytosine deaminase-like metal-dependent hydrolase n=2 Tax=Halogeometricum borinquense TaxID=60847 RepID=E4NVV0_HALBP|nr:amidohydrolase family protein [Halogeometricum borinquense]ADQ69170.1 cytosine deaminase-like metal-dependent hydrolase [Halogeometricum borinquense DSM 11551]ELY31718.1 cytosine deaminase-like metal-dependent hydrolase [Halogeometricum borinquense DSM 11551]RYJ07724.1 nucleoside deaminase [Halogeometricum borinquense]
MEALSGTLLVGRSFEPMRGRVVVEDGQIERIEETETTSTDIILPAFVNAHTHLGDSVAKEAAIGLSLDKAVAPPDSLKHRRLAAADRSDLVSAMRRTLRFIERTGTVSCLDFRESGTAGARALHEAAASVSLDPFIFGSGKKSVLDVADGYGASGANDGDFTEQRAACRKRDVPFAIHAGEPDATDIHPALDLEPDLLVHMVHAEQDHLQRVTEQSVPVAVCPRANTVLDVGTPPVRELLDHTTVALGTDNVMLNPPSMFREMAYTVKQFDVTAREVLRMATTAGAEIVGLDCGVIAPGRRAALLVLNGDSDNLTGSVDPVQAVVRRATELDVKRVLV